MPLSHSDISRIAALSRLEVPAADAQKMLDQLNGVMSLIEQLQSVDTEGVEPMTHAVDLALRARLDVVTEPNRRDAYQKNAPSVERGLFLVPKVIE
jgi:aspartyl-tRNA(Asn)/glutamyl-tRNA(Gln) amidotransferase subunit C